MIEDTFHFFVVLREQIYLPALRLLANNCYARELPMAKRKLYALYATRLAISGLERKPLDTLNQLIIE